MGHVRMIKMRQTHSIGSIARRNRYPTYLISTGSFVGVYLWGLTPTARPLPFFLSPILVEFTFNWMCTHLCDGGGTMPIVTLYVYLRRLN
jgi:hypothetical protein